MLPIYSHMMPQNHNNENLLSVIHVASQFNSHWPNTIEALQLNQMKPIITINWDTLCYTRMHGHRPPIDHALIKMQNKVVINNLAVIVSQINRHCGSRRVLCTWNSNKFSSASSMRNFEMPQSIWSHAHGYAFVIQGEDTDLKRLEKTHRLHQEPKDSISIDSKTLFIHYSNDFVSDSDDFFNVCEWL